MPNPKLCCSRYWLSIQASQACFFSESRKRGIKKIVLSSCPTMWQLWVNLGEKNTLIHRYLFHSQIMVTFQQKRMQKFKGPSGGKRRKVLPSSGVLHGLHLYRRPEKCFQFGCNHFWNSIFTISFIKAYTSYLKESAYTLQWVCLWFLLPDCNILLRQPKAHSSLRPSS